MRLRTFFVGTGDCLLLTSREGNNVLVDGGPSSGHFNDNVLPALQAVRGKGQELDLVLVTHIDDDHIDGILHMLRLYQTQSRRGLPHHIPRIGALWHNSWGQHHGRAKPSAPQPKEGPGAQTALTRVESVQRYAKSLVTAYIDINYSAPQAAEAAWLAATGRRPIRRNVGFGGDLVELTDPAHVRKVSPTMSLTVLGPTAAALEELKAIFVKEGLTSHQPQHVVRTTQAEVTALRDDRDRLAGIGDERKVTVANRASIILLATEHGQDIPTDRTCLLTGDATAQAILHGLRQSGKLTDAGPPFRCDVLKVQHHAAEGNYTSQFAERVIADHYVVSANGQHENPDTNIMYTMIEGRGAAAPNVPFTVWFTCTPGRAPNGSRTSMRTGLDAAIAAAHKVNKHHPGVVSIRVLNNDAPFFDICMCRPETDSCACISPDAVTNERVGGRHRW